MENNMTNYDFGRGDQENIKKLQARNSTPIVLKDELNIPRFEKEEVTNPKHYDQVGFGIQPLEYIIANELDFLEGNIIKYVSRYPHKGGVNDLLKARTYLEKLIEIERIKNE
tara:strand:+ start:2136 stop:2471 length:336 start_codon:yes stop_codon:yes gene_type:complete